MNIYTPPPAPTKHRYIMQVNSLEEGETGSVTMSVISMVSDRPRQRRCWMKKHLQQNHGLTRKQAFKAIRLMEFNDIRCGNSNITRFH